MEKHPESNLIRALDLAVAFATLESYGVVDARTTQANRVAEARTRLDGRHPRRGHIRAATTVRDCAPARRSVHAGRPGPATSAGRNRHRSALRRIDRMGRGRQVRPREDRTEA
jgi:hypothetical protein